MFKNKIVTQKCLEFSFSEETHKNVRNRPHGFDIKLNFKTIRTIAHIFVASSEKLNFNV